MTHDIAHLSQLDVPDELRPRVARQLGLALEWDQAVDALPAPRRISMGSLCARLCCLYRRVRPLSVGNRCAFEPSCSRYAEICFRAFGFWRGIRLTIQRLRRCNAQNGGLDLPPDLCQCATDLRGTLHEIQS